MESQQRFWISVRNSSVLSSTSMTAEANPKMVKRKTKMKRGKMRKGRTTIALGL
jgi:hypothetical protein